MTNPGKNNKTAIIGYHEALKLPGSATNSLPMTAYCHRPAPPPQNKSKNNSPPVAMPKKHRVFCLVVAFQSDPPAPVEGRPNPIEFSEHHPASPELALKAGTTKPSVPGVAEVGQKEPHVVRKVEAMLLLHLRLIAHPAREPSVLEAGGLCGLRGALNAELWVFPRILGFSGFLGVYWEGLDIH